MINLKIRGRLGNQMFQYAAALSIREKLKDKNKINVDFSTVYQYGFTNELKNFNVSKMNESNLKLSLYQYILIIKFKLVRVLFPKKVEKEKMKLEEKGLIYQEYGYHDIKLNKNCKNTMVSGFFECPKYFDNVKEQIQEEFQPINPPIEKNKKLYEEIEKSESVCVTIRRGDFLSDKYKDNFYVCTPDYFKKGIEILSKKVKNPKFFVFSDDIEWCKNNLKFLPKGTMYESGDDPAWEKLRLMYSCKHFIISNSTFSWWAQYLCRNKNKKVVAPSRWYNTGDNKDIYEDNWILIDIDKLK